MNEGYRTFDHTGDLGLEAWAETRERLYAIAAEGLCAQIAEVRDGENELSVALELQGDDPADLMVHWLNTVLLEADRAGAVWTRAEVDRLTERDLAAKLMGQRLDPRRHVFLREIKAVSHHHLALELTAPHCRCRLVLDL